MMHDFLGLGLTLMRPQMPTVHDERRSLHLCDRLAVLEEEHAELAQDWMRGIIPEIVLETWGPPDLAVNPLAELALQLSTPGLYGAAPAIDNAGGVEALTQALDGMAFWSLAQRIEYLARGMGEVCVRLEWLSGGGMAARVVMPHNVWVECHPDDPMRAVVWAELRLRYSEVRKKHVYTWDIFDVRDSDAPTFKIVEALPAATQPAKGQPSAGNLGEDMTGQFAPDLDGYPWRFPDGRPFIPAATYHSVWTGKFWNPSIMRGVYHGTLNAITYATFTGRCAHSASGSTVILSGLVPLKSSIDGTTRDGSPIQSLVVTPGMMLYHDPTDAGQPMVTEVGPGSNLGTLAAFTQGYSSQMLTRSGLSTPDAQRGHANPSSGAALYISNKDKREASQRIEPSFRRTDLELLSKVAAMLGIQRGESLPVDGYSITYHHPPESPQEEADRRDDIDWRVSRGMMSKIDAYIELHPGTTRDAAIRALRQAVEDERLINGMTPANTPPPPTPPETTDGIVPPL